MNRRSFLKAAGAGVAAAACPAAATPYLNERQGPVFIYREEDFGRVVICETEGWSMRAELSRVDSYWGTDIRHHDSGIRWGQLIPETYFANRGITIQQYLIESHEWRVGYVNLITGS